MPEFPEVVTVAEATVKKVAREPPTPKRKARRKSAKGSLSAELTVVAVDPRVWREARHLAPDPRCIQIISPTEVIVWNHGPPWPRKSSPPVGGERDPGAAG